MLRERDFSDKKYRKFGPRGSLCRSGMCLISFKNIVYSVLKYYIKINIFVCKGIHLKSIFNRWPQI
jgi:hypothetical protein